jgi:hypothetical protein
VRLLFHPLLFLAAAPLAAAPAHFASGPAPVALIELFTSEGCSSCPPADAWLGGLRDRPGLWSQFIPVQFHVDYWDGLGWKDRLARREYTQRQYAYASAWGARNVYTPCFVRNGREWKPEWGSSDTAGAPAGTLALDCPDGGGWVASFAPAPGVPQAPGGFEVHLAHLGFGISSRVTAGENGGATLEHDFVVLGIRSVALVRNSADGVLKATVELPQAAGVAFAHHAVAAWVTQGGSLTPVQATGGWLP